MVKILPRPDAQRDRDGMVAGRILLPDEYRDWEKQGQAGSDADAPRETLDSCLCERGKFADEPGSPLSFPNEIRTAMNNERR